MFPFTTSKRYSRKLEFYRWQKSKQNTTSSQLLARSVLQTSVDVRCFDPPHASPASPLTGPFYCGASPPQSSPPLHRHLGTLPTRHPRWRAHAGRSPWGWAYLKISFIIPDFERIYPQLPEFIPYLDLLLILISWILLQPVDWWLPRSSMDPVWWRRGACDPWRGFGLLCCGLGVLLPILWVSKACVSESPTSVAERCEFICHASPSLFISLPLVSVVANLKRGDGLVGLKYYHRLLALMHSFRMLLGVQFILKKNLWQWQHLPNACLALSDNNDMHLQISMYVDRLFSTYAKI